jgi:putative salt-induced outer membrane protein YdiY
MSRLFLSGIVTILILIAAPLAVTAEEAEESWQPAPPMPDDFDWIQLTSGEWLKGKITAMFDDSLDFDSKELDELTLDFSDIQQIRSARVFQVAFLGDTVATGKVLMDGDSVRVIGEEEYSSTRSQVLSITAGGARERDYWSGKLSAGLNIRSGNTDQTDYNASANFMRRSPKNRINIDYLGNFSQTDDTTTADNQRLTAGWNRFLSDRFYITPVYGKYYRDPFQNLASRWSLSVGLGYQLVDTAKVDWQIDGGVGYQKTAFDEVPVGEPESEGSPALVLGTDYENKLTKWMEYFFKFDFSIVNEESGKYTHHLETGFEFDLWGDFDFDVTWVWDRIQEPQEDAAGITPEQDDFRMIFAVGLSF